MPLILMFLQLTHDASSAFTMRPAFATHTTASTSTSTATATANTQTMLRVSPQNDSNSNSNSNDDQPPPLFDMSDIDATTTGATYQVQEDVDKIDQDDSQFDVDMDAIDIDIDIDIDVEYDLEYDRNEKDDDLYNTNIDDLQTDIYSNMIQDSTGIAASTIASAEFSRDQDDMLTEREDRLYVNENREKCILVGVENLAEKRRSARNMASEVYFDLDQSMEEMKELISTSGMDLAGVITQRLNDVNPKTYIGTGKVTEAQDLLAEVDSCTVIFDAELSPGQQKALENAFNKEVIQNDFLGSEKAAVKVIDRTALILDIFAQHAKTREGKLQVDLALHEYRKPRLTKMWTHLERQSGAGGVGLRGPGESQLEIDKRLLKDRIIVLKRKIDNVQKQRDIHRKGRSNLGLPVLALVGYTNAGKSTLLNHLTRAGVMAEDILFATLDPTTRKVKLPGLKTHPEVLLTDTVGFIQKLPTQLVAAFRATLEEVKQADVLVHVIDSSNPVWQKQEMAVKTVLAEIGAGDKPMVRVLNKIDLLDEEVAEDLQYEAAMMDDFSVAISSKTGEGMTDLVSTIEDAMMGLLKPIEVLIPYENGKDVNLVQEVGHVEEMEFREEGTYLLARVPEAVANRLKPFYINLDEEETVSGGGDDEIDWVAIGRGRHPKKQET